ncbi:MAG: DNA polymerase III subunit delta [Flavobacteriaceae bacterium]|nr:DNA polymerase III subunit delta [Flavobacteriaceae bacterium]
MKEVKEIINDVKSKNFKPIYFLYGPETYYIDQISDYFEEHALQEEEKGFNQMILYGADIGVDDITANAKRFPMMAEKQLLIIKEAQHLSKSIDKLLPYLKNPVESTILVICYRHPKGLDKRKAPYKALKKNGRVFESKSLYENQIGDWIQKRVRSMGYTLHPKAMQMLIDSLGTSMGKIQNELNKLDLVLEKGAEISPIVIEKNIGISKDFNNFELRKAIGDRNVVKAMQIVKYFENNPKDNPLVLTIGMLYSYFAQLFAFHGLENKSDGNVSKALNIHSFFVREYRMAASNFGMKQISQIIHQIRVTDLKSKGVGAGNISHGDLLRELMVKIMY